MGEAQRFADARKGWALVSSGHHVIVLNRLSETMLESIHTVNDAYNL
jgi:hypothetical protein